MLYNITRFDKSERNAKAMVYVNGLTFEQAVTRLLELKASAKSWVMYDIEKAS